MGESALKIEKDTSPTEGKEGKPDSSKPVSGIRTYQQGEIIFKEKDQAESLFIIQKGQIRLYRPKGKGFVEVAILRTGEVIGEMAYFDDNINKRSCSAAAITETEVIEISFRAFDKTMESLNPWFTTIINTLANRLRKTNERVKSIESNSITLGLFGKAPTYRFLSNADVTKLLSLIFLTLETHGERQENRIFLHLEKLKYYAEGVFAISEIKLEEFVQLMQGNRFFWLDYDQQKLPEMINIKNTDDIRNLLVFYNKQRRLREDQKIVITKNCLEFLEAIIKMEGKNVAKKALRDRPDQKQEDRKCVVNISPLLQFFKKNKRNITEDDLKPALEWKLIDEITFNNNKFSVSFFHDKLKKNYLGLKLINAVEELNASKKFKC